MAEQPDDLLTPDEVCGKLGITQNPMPVEYNTQASRHTGAY